MFLFNIRRIGYLQPRITFHRYVIVFPCKMTPNMLSFWEEVEVDMQIQFHNPNIGFVIKCGMQGPMRPRKCV
jgi:hypothetical protein